MVGALVILLLTGSLLVTAVVLAQDTDMRIESAFRSSYVFKTYLKGDDIRISSRDGVVTLTGRVSDETHLSLAADTVAGLPGVKSVDNKLEVEGGIPEKLSDAWIHTKVKAVLMLHSHLDAMDTEVTVKDGRVTLQGEAANLAEKELATEYVKDIDGVKAVDNMMTVAKTSHEDHRTVGESIDDASIKAQIKLALLLHRGTNVLKSEIHVEKGVVTVTGQARNAAEKDLVTKRIEDIHGVKKVHNNMTIVP